MNGAENIADEAPQQEGASRRARGMPRQASPYPYDPRAKSPLLAGFLSLMPGLGQIYVGYYQRGFIHILVAGSLIALLASGELEALTPLMGLFLAFFWLYNIIDAARRASLYNMALQGTDPMAVPEDFQMPGTRGSIAGGLALIVMGVILLTHTRFGMSLDWLRDWWPMVPVLFGAWLVFKGMKSGDVAGLKR